MSRLSESGMHIGIPDDYMAKAHIPVMEGHGKAGVIRYLRALHNPPRHSEQALRNWLGRPRSKLETRSRWEILQEQKRARRAQKRKPRDGSVETDPDEDEAIVGKMANRAWRLQKEQERRSIGFESDSEPSPKRRRTEEPPSQRRAIPTARAPRQSEPTLRRQTANKKPTQTNAPSAPPKTYGPIEASDSSSDSGSDDPDGGAATQAFSKKVWAGLDEPASPETGYDAGDANAQEEAQQDDRPLPQKLAKADGHVIGLGTDRVRPYRPPQSKQPSATQVPDRVTRASAPHNAKAPLTAKEARNVIQGKRNPSKPARQRQQSSSDDGFAQSFASAPEDPLEQDQLSSGRGGDNEPSQQEEQEMENGDNEQGLGEQDQEHGEEEEEEEEAVPKEEDIPPQPEEDTDEFQPELEKDATDAVDSEQDELEPPLDGMTRKLDPSPGFLTVAMSCTKHLRDFKNEHRHLLKQQSLTQEDAVTFLWWRCSGRFRTMLDWLKGPEKASPAAWKATKSKFFTEAEDRILRDAKGRKQKKDLIKRKGYEAVENRIDWLLGQGDHKVKRIPDLTRPPSSDLSDSDR